MVTVIVAVPINGITPYIVLTKKIIHKINCQINNIKGPTNLSNRNGCTYFDNVLYCVQVKTGMNPIQNVTHPMV